jgi:hypothetical protein
MVRPVVLLVASHTEHDAIEMRKHPTQRLSLYYREWVMIFCRSFANLTLKWCIVPS